MLNAPQRQLKKVNANINIVPYIDVMLVLLIIFMMTTPIIEQGIEINLPQSATNEIIDFSNNRPTIVSIDKNSKYYINSLDDETPDDDKNLKLTTIVAMIKGRAAIYNNMQIYIRADKAVNYGVVVDLMSFLQKNGVNKVGIITESVNEN